MNSLTGTSENGWKTDRLLAVAGYTITHDHTVAIQRERRMLEGRDWFAVSGATPEKLAELKAVAPPDLPSRYVDLLAFSNGGEGPLPMNPYTLCLDPADTVTAGLTSDNHGQADLAGFLIFGGNGGGDYLAFDTRAGAPWPIVSIDMVAGGSSAEVIAPDFDAFFDRIGVEAATT